MKAINGTAFETTEGTLSELKKILYADDEPDLRKIVSLTLKSIGGYEVKSCANGAEAVAAVEDFTPDLILLDVMMPVMTGQEALEAFREREETSDTPIIFITAKARPQDIQRLTSASRTGVVIKPFESGRLSKEIHDIWSRLMSEEVS